MKDPREIDSSEILREVSAAVSSARESVLATMQASEELANPLPRDYFVLLMKKMDAGVKVTRLGFGSREQFELLKAVSVEHRNYRFLRTNSDEYRRMICVDNTRLFFNMGGRFYLTTDHLLLSEYLTYFENQMLAAQQ